MASIATVRLDLRHLRVPLQRRRHRRRPRPGAGLVHPAFRDLEIRHLGGALSRRLNWLCNNGEPRRTGKGWSSADHQRLLDIKAQYDPQNVFRSGYSVQPA